MNNSVIPKLGIFLIIVMFSVGCKWQEPLVKESSPKETFDALWKILDERYCFFDLKLTYGQSWRDIYYKYLSYIDDSMSEDELFDVLNNMIKELKDGHTNIITPFDYGHNWSWQYFYNDKNTPRNPNNLNISLIRAYLGNNYRIAGGINYKMLDLESVKKDSVGYMYIPSFSSSISHSNIDAALLRLKGCRGLIIDIRGNGGGNITTAEILASHFYNINADYYTTKGKKIGYIRHKIGKGHNEFSKATPIYLKRVNRGVVWLRPTVIITNGSVYSAANDFVSMFKGLPFVTILGDVTGGGSGLPMSSELPNGWVIRYSSSRITDSDDQDVEFGISPNLHVDMDINDIKNGIDTYIIEAVNKINSIYREHVK